MIQNSRFSNDAAAGRIEISLTLKEKPRKVEQFLPESD
jgi:hypothetical protein